MEEVLNERPEAVAVLIGAVVLKCHRLAHNPAIRRESATFAGRVLTDHAVACRRIRCLAGFAEEVDQQVVQDGTVGAVVGEHEQDPSLAGLARDAARLSGAAVTAGAEHIAAVAAGATVSAGPTAATAVAALTQHRQQTGVAAGAAAASTTAGDDRGSTDAAVAAVTHEQSAVAAGSTIPAGDPGAAVAAVTEPSSRPAAAAVVATAATAPQTAVTAVAGGDARAGPFVIAEAVAYQDPAIGILGGAVAEEDLENRASTQRRTRIGHGWID